MAMDINRNNYETFFLNYLDRELSPADRQSVEKFISENADLQKEFLLLQQTILSPTDVIFEPKTSLFREEEKRRIIPFYRARIAAAVAVLILGSWYMRTIVFKNNVRNLSGKVPIEARKNNVVKENKSPAVVSHVIKTHGDAKKNSTINPVVKKQDRSYSRLNKEPEDQVASKKSSSALEIQSADSQTGINPEQIPTVSGTQTQVLVIVAKKSNDSVQNERAALKEQDFQSDDAISVVGLNDRNKAIAGFFKKLTKRAPADENARKLRVSVFQISY
jgi:hypothetical protein